MMDENDQVIDWDGEVGNDGEPLALLPDGDEVRLTVRSVAKGHSKDGAAPMVTLEFAAESVNGHGRTLIRDHIKMTRKMEWKLCELFTALGLRKHGEKLRLRWDLDGATARATVTVDSFTGRDGDERKNNKIKRYLPPLESAADDEFA